MKRGTLLAVNRVHEFRKRLGLTVWELADRSFTNEDPTSLSARLVFAIEKDPNYNCNLTTILKISAGLRVPPSVLFFSEEERSESIRMFDEREAAMRICKEVFKIPDVFFHRILMGTKVRTLKGEILRIASKACAPSPSPLQSREHILVFQQREPALPR